MEDFQFSPYTMAILEMAGWYPERSVDISMYIQSLRADDYTVFPVVRKFLENFGGLIITWSTVFEFKVINHQIHFDASVATNEVYPEQIAEYSEKLCKSLCVIGECQGVTLVMDEKGVVYGGADHFIWFDGENGCEAIENTITGKNIKRLFPNESY